MRECEGCGKREFSNERLFKFCGRCKRVLYCSKECQRKDWGIHKISCHECTEDVDTLPHCGLCGARKGPFTLTECCNRMVCDDSAFYRVGSFSRIHCLRNHRRFTSCGAHFDEGHSGRWQDCERCRRVAYNPEQIEDCYDYAARAGNPPHLPFKFNFDETAKKFDWSVMECPSCVICNKKVDTVLDDFATPISIMSTRVIVCMSCHVGDCVVWESPVLLINNSMDRS